MFYDHPAFKPIRQYLLDPEISEIMINGPSQIFVERQGRMELTAWRFDSAQQLSFLIEQLLKPTGRTVSPAAPYVDFRLPDGSRANVTIPPITLNGATVTIRKALKSLTGIEDLLRLGTLSTRMAHLLAAGIQGRLNMLFSGATGTGKTTTLGILSAYIPETERIITIEDTAELVLDQDHVVRMETRPPNIEGAGEVTARDLVVNSLRMRPDRIIVGEVRSSEALDMLQALNTGHDGGMSTIHANSPRDGLARLETMVLMAGLELPSRAIREQITAAIHLLVQVRRYEDGVRRIESIAEISGMEGNTPLLQEIYKFHRIGRQGNHVLGEYVATGIVPRIVIELRDQGFDFPLDLFQKPRGHGNV